MKEILESKVMIGFIFFILGICYFNTVDINRQTNMKDDHTVTIISEN